MFLLFLVFLSSLCFFLLLSVYFLLFFHFLYFLAAAVGSPFLPVLRFGLRRAALSLRHPFLIYMFTYVPASSCVCTPRSYTYSDRKKSNSFRFTCCKSPHLSTSSAAGREKKIVRGERKKKKTYGDAAVPCTVLKRKSPPFTIRRIIPGTFITLRIRLPVHCSQAPFIITDVLFFYFLFF